MSATFAASLVTSPAIGAYLGRVYGDGLVVVLASAIAMLDICFILVAVPESLPEKMRPASWGAPISWEQADPFAVSTWSTSKGCQFLYPMNYPTVMFMYPISVLLEFNMIWIGQMRCLLLTSIGFMANYMRIQEIKV